MKLCDDWIAASIRTNPDGGISMSDNGLGLLAQGIKYSDLSVGEIRETCAGLTKTMLFGRLNAYIRDDHLVFWAWAAEVLAGPILTAVRTDEDQQIATAHGLATRMMLASTYVGEDPAALSLCSHARLGDIFTHSMEIGCYVAFPLLEAALRRACGVFVGQDGRVGTAFSVRRPAPQSSERYGIGRRINSIRDLLWLLRDGYGSVQLAKPDTIEALGVLEATFQTLGGSDDGFDVLFTWRNSTLHGEQTLRTVGGAVLNAAILVMLDGYTDVSYESRRVEIQDNLAWRSTAPWSYYPM